MSCVDGMANEETSRRELLLGSGSGSVSGSGDFRAGSAGTFSAFFFGCARSFFVTVASGTLKTSFGVDFCAGGAKFMDLRRDFMPEVFREPKVVGVTGESGVLAVLGGFLAGDLGGGSRLLSRKDLLI